MQLVSDNIGLFLRKVSHLKHDGSWTPANAGRCLPPAGLAETPGALRQPDQLCAQAQQCAFAADSPSSSKAAEQRQQDTLITSSWLKNVHRGEDKRCIEETWLSSEENTNQHEAKMCNRRSRRPYQLVEQVTSKTSKVHKQEVCVVLDERPGSISHSHIN